MIRELAWQILAWIVSRGPVATWLIGQAQTTPYSHIRGRDDTLYMGRWWLFNPYAIDTLATRRRWGERFPSIRIHWICRPDLDRHLHDHPWDARTIILRGGYTEERQIASSSRLTNTFHRPRGYTGTLSFGEFHRIDRVAHGGAWTMFITWKKQGTWGFDVDGVKVPYREYLGIQP